MAAGIYSLPLTLKGCLALLDITYACAPHEPYGFNSAQNFKNQNRQKGGYILIKNFHLRKCSS